MIIIFFLFFFLLKNNNFKNLANILHLDPTTNAEIYTIRTKVFKEFRFRILCAGKQICPNMQVLQLSVSECYNECIMLLV